MQPEINWVVNCLWQLFSWRGTRIKWSEMLTEEEETWQKQVRLIYPQSDEENVNSLMILSAAWSLWWDLLWEINGTARFMFSSFLLIFWWSISVLFFSDQFLFSSSLLIFWWSSLLLLSNLLLRTEKEYWERLNLDLLINIWKTESKRYSGYYRM